MIDSWGSIELSRNQAAEAAIAAGGLPLKGPYYPEQGSRGTVAWQSLPMKGTAGRIGVQMVYPLRVQTIMKAGAVGFAAVRGTYGLATYTSSASFTVAQSAVGLMSGISAGPKMAVAIYEASSPWYQDATLNYMPKGAPIAVSTAYAIKDLTSLWAINGTRWIGALLCPIAAAPTLLPSKAYFVSIIVDCLLTGETGPRILGWQDSYDPLMPGITQAQQGWEFPVFTHKDAVASGWDANPAAAFKSDWNTLANDQLALAGLSTINADLVAHRDNTTSISDKPGRYKIAVVGV